MNHPVAVRPETRNKQKTIADFLALGMNPQQISERIGVSVEYIRTLLRGELFQFEIEQARERLVGEQVKEYRKMVAEQLIPNLHTLIEIRDDGEAKHSDRLRAVEIMESTVVPKARPKESTQLHAHLHLTPEQADRARGAMSEIDEPGTDSSE